MFTLLTRYQYYKKTEKVRCISVEKLVSIIVPAYNSEKYIEECLNSIMQQTYSNYEIIVMNDGSTDNTEEIVLTLQKKNQDKIHYMKQENSGVGQARNVAMKKACRGLSYLYR